MELFIAGNFPQMNDINEERAARDRALEMNQNYHRLASFFYENGAVNILQIKREFSDGKNSLDR